MINRERFNQLGLAPLDSVGGDMFDQIDGRPIGFPSGGGGPIYYSPPIIGAGEAGIYTGTPTPPIILSDPIPVTRPVTIPDPSSSPGNRAPLPTVLSSATPAVVSTAQPSTGFTVSPGLAIAAVVVVGLLIFLKE